MQPGRALHESRVDRALVPVAGMSYAADKIASFVIDLDDGIVTSSLGEFAITELTPSRISFKAKHGETAWYGGLDRFSGYAIVTVQRGNEIVIDYKLTCKPAKPLF